MWAFEKFPVTLEYTPTGDDRPTYMVEILGYSCLIDTLNVGSITLVCHREKAFWVEEEISDIKFLPLNEFEKRFKKFKLR